MMLGIAMIGVALGTIGGFLMERQEEILRKAMQKARRKKERLLSPAQFKLFYAVVLLFVFVVGGSVVFYYLNEMDAYDDGWTLSFFWTVQTVTTVGYGYPIATTTGSKGFAIPFILFGTLLVAAALGTFADVFIERRQEQIANSILKAEFDLEAILAMDTDGDAQIDMAEFLEYMLVAMGKVSQIDITKIKAQFHELDADGSGVLDSKDIALLKQRALAGNITSDGHHTGYSSDRSLNADY